MVTTFCIDNTAAATESLGAGVTVEYTDTGSNAIAFTISYPGSAYLAFGPSPGGMIGSKVVIGTNAAGAQKYSLNSRTTPSPDPTQDFTDASFTQSNGISTLSFTAPLTWVEQFATSPGGAVRMAWARGSSSPNNLGYHGSTKGTKVFASFRSFCSTYQTVCVDQSKSTAYPDCEGTLAAMSAGTSGDTSGDTQACREYHLGVAQSADPDVHCPHAGPDGGGVCIGSETFCAQYQSTCVSTGLSAAFGDCATEYNVMAIGTDGDTSGDTLACRKYHLGVAQSADPNVHCPHAGPSGGGVCVGPETFCAQYQSTCVGAGLSSAYTDCAADYNAMTAGTDGDTSGDTVACREYHLGVAMTTDPSVHCPHAGLSGGGVCVPAFCSTYQTTCVDAGHSSSYTDCEAAYRHV